MYSLSSVVRSDIETAFGFHFTNRPTNLTEHDDEFVIEVPMTGIPKENIKVELTGRTLNISGSVEKSVSKGKEIKHNLSKQNVKAVYTVPAGTTEQDIDVRVENGLLTATIKKKKQEGLATARIEIK